MPTDPLSRAAAIARLRDFDRNLAARPDYAAMARSRPIDELLRSMRGYVPDDVIDPLLAAIAEHNLTWEHAHPDVYTFTAEMIAGAVRFDP